MKMQEVLNLDTNTFSVFTLFEDGELEGKPFYTMEKVINNVSAETLSKHSLFKKYKNKEVNVKFLDGKALVSFIVE